MHAQKLSIKSALLLYLNLKVNILSAKGYEPMIKPIMTKLIV